MALAALEEQATEEGDGSLLLCNSPANSERGRRRTPCREAIEELQ